MRFLITAVFILFVSCGQKKPEFYTGDNYRDASSQQSQTVYGNGSFASLNQAAVAESTAVDDLVVKDDELVVGLPYSAFGKTYLFGGVITQAANKKDSSMGRLKLSDLEPVHVKIVGRKDGDKKIVDFKGCATECVEDDFNKTLFSVRVMGQKNIEGRNYVLLDMNDLVTNMKIVEKVSNVFTRGLLVVKESKIISTDYSRETLVFDVRTDMEPFKLGRWTLSFKRKTNVVSRWYLRPSQPVIAKDFESRPEVKGVGFFMTNRFKKKNVTRFALPSENKSQKIKYYIKGAPKGARLAMTQAFKDWNDTFFALTGEELLEHEFVEKSDKRFPLIQPGDIRFNVIEWDTTNKAPYGGLGPSMAFQKTGQILSGNVLIQGPSIVARHRKWFGLDKSEEGASANAEEPKSKNLGITIGNELNFRVPSAMPEYHDPIMADGADYGAPPEGISYTDYMMGYFRELTAHEIGHNLGLRHNFKGNLGASDEPKLNNGASRSVMDYLGRDHRHIVEVGSYDRMAIDYAYAGKKPHSTNWFCTDQDVVKSGDNNSSPECQRYDLTNDPYGYWRSELKKAVSAYLEFDKSKNEKKKTMASKVVDRSIDGMLAFASKSEATSDQWSSWRARENRPNENNEIHSYIAKDLRVTLCENKSKYLRERLLSAAKSWGLEEKIFACRPNIKVKIKF